MRSGAAEFRFDDADRGPAPFLTISDVTVSSPAFVNGLPTTVLGSGLGSSLLGAPDSVDGTIHYTSGVVGGGLNPDTFEGLTLSVSNGFINSLTLRPNYSVITPGQVAIYNFEMAFWAQDADYGLTPGWLSIDPNAGELTVDVRSMFFDLSFPKLSLWIGPDLVQPPLAHRAAGYTPDETYTFGVTIVALNYTLAPEPTTFALLALGSVVLLVKRREGSPG